MRALFGRGASGDERQCLRCGLVYSARAGRSEDEEEDLIAERMSRIESQMSGFNSSLAPLDPLPEADGLHLRPKYEMKCARCGHFDFIEPTPDAACPKCGRVYDKVADAVRQEEANTPKPRSVSL
ncbi:hypothetical protein [Ramlibacter rhizophilus]|uniref:Uncharacterized protein n=1 Tax=Ramlibacter rhizophilus TaxID=1781167 RepID=A0A4Z0BEZ2_9BURK|nr:hypothetical protein [Ramlibacter rhizophilus]TFY97390.1 hypothetical protein EZ242_17855 [Ramlibacter rhizophilus]